MKDLNEGTKELKIFLLFLSEIKAVAALLGVSGVSLYRGLTTKTKNVRGQILRSLCDSVTVSWSKFRCVTNRQSLLS